MTFFTSLPGSPIMPGIFDRVSLRRQGHGIYLTRFTLVYRARTSVFL